MLAAVPCKKQHNTNTNTNTMKETKQLPEDIREEVSKWGIYVAVWACATTAQAVALQALAYIANRYADNNGRQYYPAYVLDSIEEAAAVILAPYGFIPDKRTATDICECCDGLTLAEILN